MRCEKAGPSSAKQFVFECKVENTGDRDGDEVVLVYHSAGSSIRALAQHPVPIMSLVRHGKTIVLSKFSICFQPLMILNLALKMVLVMYRHVDWVRAGLSGKG
eukprot:SAG31_NODE_4476_length_3202_cov_3.425717_3_plen_103_part_00